MRKHWRLSLAGLALALLAVAAGLILSSGSPAAAGIGPAGFATYARQGIIQENCRVYGKCSNSPWVVHCTDHPDYATISDRVVCTVTIPTMRAQVTRVLVNRHPVHLRHLAHLAHLAYLHYLEQVRTAARVTSYQAGGPEVSGGTLTYAGLEALWESAGGPAWAAPTAACIAEHESSGQQYATGAAGERGYWQINPDHGSLSTYNAWGNAHAAVLISDYGRNWSAWTTRIYCGV